MAFKALKTLSGKHHWFITGASMHSYKRGMRSMQLMFMLACYINIDGYLSDLHKYIEDK